jgi:glycyl-tRNA synthetase beta chain
MARDLVFEIGVEEIPSAALYDAVSQLQGLAEKRLKSLLLGYEDVRVYGSPRRLVVLVLGLAERQEDLHQRIKGPAAKSAFGPEGRPTPAAIGFARGKGVAVSELVREEEGGKEYVFAVIDREGAASGDVLPDALGSLAAEIQWPKSQRWGIGDARFIRPVRWLLALYGSEVVRVRFAGLTADRLTWGHRFLAKNPISVPDADQYFEALERGKVMVDGATRAEFLREGIDAAAESAGARAVVPEKVFAEVVNLVEYPTVAVGHFDDAFLRVPREVLETAMESHQRYFPLESAEGTLTDGFIVAHNGDPDLTEAIVRGHERVIRARLADAAFFYDEDLKANMEDWVERLETSVFHEKLGTLAAKTERIETLVGVLAEICGAGPDTSAAAVRAAHLAKADLVSHAVVEFPVLQGVMGRYYALAAGEEPEVADAILEHYRPRFAGDALPGSAAGMLLSAADKLDTICGIFAIGQGPTGSADPYALRRSAIGVLAMILEGGLAITLHRAIEASLESYRDATSFEPDDVGAAISAFFKGRLGVLLRDRGLAHDIISAVLLDSTVNDPADVLARATALTTMRASDAGADVLVAFKRAANLADPSAGVRPDATSMGPQEKALYDAVLGVRTDLSAAITRRSYDEAIGLLASLRDPVDAFFEGVLVMDPDETVRHNRLALLNMVIEPFAGFADLAALEG